MARSRYIGPVVGVLLSAAVLSSCGGGKAPTGQVVATVDGDEITTTELKMELGGASGRTPEAQKALERAALQAIVNRRLLVKAAKERRIDRLPAYAVAQRKAADIALIQLMQQQAADGAGRPPADEVRRYVSSHPDSFAERKILAVDQLEVADATRAVVEAMRPLTTLEQVAGMLSARGVAFRRSQGMIDGLSADPEAVKRIVAMPAGEVFVMPVGAGVVVNRVRGMQVAPVAPADAERVAGQMLAQARTRALVDRQMGEVIRAGMAGVRYNDSYGPPAPAGSVMPPVTDAPAAPAGAPRTPVAVPGG